MSPSPFMKSHPAYAAGRHPRLSRAERKKMRRTFASGDVVTWGIKLCSHRIVEVLEDGLIVDASRCPSSVGFSDPRYFVPWSEGVVHSDVLPADERERAAAEAPRMSRTRRARVQGERT